MKIHLLCVIALVSILTACSTGRGLPAPIESRDGGDGSQNGRPQQEVQQGRVMPQGAQPNVYPAQSRSVITGPRPTPSPTIDSNAEPVTQPISDSVSTTLPNRAPTATITPSRQLPTQTPRTDVPATPALPPSRSRPSNSTAPAMALLASAESAIAAGDLERAAALCERALRITPRDGYLWYRLAAIHYQQQKYDEATGFARRALSFAGSDQALTQDINVLLESADAARSRVR